MDNPCPRPGWSAQGPAPRLPDRPRPAPVNSCGPAPLRQARWRSGYVTLGATSDRPRVLLLIDVSLMRTPAASRLLAWRPNGDAKEKSCEKSGGKRAEVSKGESSPGKASRHPYSPTPILKLAAFPPKFRLHTASNPFFLKTTGRVAWHALDSWIVVSVNYTFIPGVRSCPDLTLTLTFLIQKG